MTSVVFDASAIVAILEQEPGWEVVRKYVDDGIASTVNISEAIHILVERGAEHERAVNSVRRLQLEQIPFDDEQAIVAASLHARTRRKGISLGDRACLGLALLRKIPVITGDNGWRELDLGLDIKWFR